MSFFIVRKQFLVPSFELNKKEVEKIDKFLLFLEESNVGFLIEKYILNTTSRGGRPNVNYYNLFATIVYGFAFSKDTLRDLSDACNYDLRYIYLMEQVRPSYTTFANFINNVIIPNEKEIFSLLNLQIKREMNIDFEDAFVDGTKYEANANKYKFVWKPNTYHKKLSCTFFKLLRDNSLCEGYRVEELVKSKTVSSAIDELVDKKLSFNESVYLSLMKSLNSILEKVLEYEEKENICGNERNSFYKTDHDATAMCLKSDYYSKLGTNMHAAYNNQILVVKGLVFSYFVSNSRADMQDFIPLLVKFKELYGCYPKNICADSGYESLENYRFMKENNIISYVKYFSWEGNVSGRNPDCYKLNDDNKSITCLNGNVGYKVEIEGRHPKKSKRRIF